MRSPRRGISLPRVLGIDPTLRNLGWCVLDVTPTAPLFVAAGVYRTKKRAFDHKSVAEDDWGAVEYLLTGMADIVERYRINAMVLEQPGGSKSASGAKSLAYGVTICNATCHRFSLPAERIGQVRAKILLTGKQSVSKEKIAAIVKRRIGIPPSTLNDYPPGVHEHIYDSAAVVLAAWEGRVMREQRNRARGMPVPLQMLVSGGDRALKPKDGIVLSKVHAVRRFDLNQSTLCGREVVSQAWWGDGAGGDVDCEVCHEVMAAKDGMTPDTRGGKT